jgi:tetratricopeptide (TPR) repeat protein
MSRKDDLEHQIRESYDIIHQYEEITQTSDRPEEVQRAEHKIEEQWGRIREPLVQYLALCKRRNLATPEDIVEIAVTFGPELDEEVGAYRPPLLPLPSGRGWIYGAVGLAVILVGVITALIIRGLAVTPEPLPTSTPTPTEISPTSTSTPTPTLTPTQLPPPPTPTSTPIFSQGALYRVAISQFDARNTQPVEIAQRLEDDLRANLRSSGLSDDVDIKVVPSPIISADQAHTFASNAESDVLIWGWYDSLGIRLYVLLGERVQANAPNVTGLHELPLGAVNEAGELSFYVHDVLPSNTTFLSMFVIGHLYYLSNNYTEGYKAFDTAMANIPETVALENEALPHFFNARLMQTATYTDPTEIICEYARAIELDPSLFEAYNNLGVLLLENPNYYEQPPCVQGIGISLNSHHLFEQALQIRPDWALTQYNMAVLDWNAGSFDPVKEKLTLVLESDPSIAGAHIVLGNLAILEGDFELGVEYFSNAVALWPESAEVAVNLGQALALAGQDNQAIASYQRALGLAPNDEVYQEAHLALGNVYHRLGNLERAYREYLLVESPIDECSDFNTTLSLALAKYEIDAGEWASATHRLEVYYCGLAGPSIWHTIPHYLLWLIHTIQGNPEASDYADLPSSCSEPLWYWTRGDTVAMTWCDIEQACKEQGSLKSDVTAWGTESNPCLPNGLEDRLEAVYANFQQRVHYRLFFVKEIQALGAACPYVFTYDNQYRDLLLDTTIIYRLIGPEAEQLQARPLTRFDGRLWLRELEPETSYVDQLYVRVLTADGRWLTLAPDVPALIADDGDYLILQQGDERILEFELPSGALPIQQAWVVADGYYVPYDARE